MNIQESYLFPTKIIETFFSKQEIDPLIKEVLSNLNKIKEIHSIYTNIESSQGEDYFTDFGDSIKLHEYEKLIIQLKKYFNDQNYFFNLGNYWTAYHGDISQHIKHTHKDNFERRNSINYSSVLYLTNTGQTNFYGDNSSCLDKVYITKAEVGKMIIFPANLLHEGLNLTKEKRIIISSNLEIYK